jgi:hypothetical protein
MNVTEIHLFIAGRTPNALAAIANIRRALERPALKSVVLQIIDVHERRDLARRTGRPPDTELCLH